MTFVRRQILHFAAGALASPAAARFCVAQATSGIGAAADLAAIARDMYLFTFPLYQNYRQRLTNTTTTRFFNPPAAINELRHFRALADHTFREAANPNNDTLYSVAFLDLSRGPLILEVPEIRDRYYSLQFMDSFADSFAYIGTRTTGSVGGRYLISGPGQKVSPPSGMPVISSPTNAPWLLGRILVVNPDDLPRVHELQDLLKLYPTPGTEVSLPFNGPPITPNDPWNYFAVVNHVLTESPPGERDAAITARIRIINVGPGESFDRAKFNQADQKALLDGIDEARRLISNKSADDEVVNGWSYLFGAGKFGTNYLLRAQKAAVVVAGFEPEESMYMRDAGEPLDGSQNYRLHFASDPPVNAFWSLSMYEVAPDGRLFFTENPIRRYSIGDRTPGLTHNADGSLDIYIQHDRPSGGRETNWLPTPVGRFSLVLRAFLPKQELLEHKYALPPLMRSN